MKNHSTFKIHNIFYEAKIYMLFFVYFKGNCQKVTEILKAHPDISANETVDSAQNRLLHKAARYVQCMLLYL